MANFELRIETSEFKKVLDVLSTVVNRKNALPILSCARFSYDPAARVFTSLAGNSEQYLAVECTKVDDGERRPWMFFDGKGELEPFCVNVETFREAFACLPAYPAVCTLTEQGASLLLKVNYGKGEFTLPVERALDYPVVPEVVEKGVTLREGVNAVCKFQLKSALLLPLLSAARSCAANDPLRPQMNTVCLDVWQDKLIVVASDGHTMYRNQLDLGSPWLDYGEFAADASERLLLPVQSIGAILKAFGTAEVITVVADSQRVRLQSADGITLTSAQQEGRYPNYDSVIPKNQPHRVLLDRQEVQMTLRRLSVFSAEASNMAVLRQVGDKLELHASDEEFSRSAGEQVAIVNGEAVDLGTQFRLGFKISHMQQMLAICQTEQVYLEMRDAQTALLVKEDSAKSSLTLLVMPMLIN